MDPFEPTVHLYFDGLSYSICKYWHAIEKHDKRYEMCHNHSVLAFKRPQKFDRSVGVTWNCIKTRTMISLTMRIVVANILSHPARYYVCIPTSAGGLLVSYGNTRPVVSASALTWFIRYIYDWNLQFLNNVIINKTKVLLPHA